MVLQIIGTLALIFGFSLGELTSSKAFGKINKPWIYFLNTILFIIIISIIFSSLSMKTNPLLVFFIYFVSGFFVIVGIRGVTSVAGFYGTKYYEEKKYKLYSSQILGLIRNLRKNGIKDNKIKKILLKSHFKEKDVDIYLKELSKV